MRRTDRALREPATRLAAGLALAASLASTAGVLAEECRAAGHASSAGPAVFLLALMAGLHWLAARYGGPLSIWLLGLVSACGLLAAPFSPAGTSVMAAALVLATLSGWGRVSTAARDAVLFCAPLTALVALTLVPSAVGLAAAPVSFLAALAARLWTRRSDPRGRPQSSSDLRGARAAGSLPRTDRTRRGLAAALATALAFAAWPLVHGALEAIPNPVPARWQDAIRASAPVTPLSSSADAGPAGDDEPAGEFGGVFPDQVDFRGSVDELEHQEVLTVRPRGPRPRSLYLRGLVLEDFGPTGARMTPRALELLRDSDDGLRDGWVELVPRAASSKPPDASAVTELEVDSLALTAGSSRASPLFVTRETCAVRIAELSRAGPVLAIERPVQPGGRLRYGLRVSSSDARSASAPVVDERELARCLSLPSEPELQPAVDYIALRAARLVGADESLADLTRIERLVADFARFEYALDSTDRRGLPGLVDFLERRRGYCTYFAGATVLSLRSLGIPARFVSGFLAETWDPERGLFGVSTRDGHAWAEAWVEGRGWVRIEPTPSDSRAAFLASLDADEPTTLRAWAREAAFELELWVRTAGREPSLSSLGATLLRGAQALGRALRSVRGGQLGGLALGLLAWRLALRRRRRSRPGADGLLPSAALARVAAAREELFEALASAGFRRPGSSTAHEFTASLRQRSDARAALPLERLSRLVERLESARWGRAPLLESEHSEIRALARDVQRNGDSARPSVD